MSSFTTRLPSHLSRRAFLTGTAATTGLLLTGAALLETAPAEASTSLAWGGFVNGRIPLAKLTALPRNGGYLRYDAAIALGRFTKDFAAAFGGAPALTQGYRTYAQQMAFWLQRYVPHNSPVADSIKWSGRYWVKKPNVAVAAVPGSSLHGWALAVDFSSGIQKAGSPQKKWADKYGPKYAWYPVGNTFGEPWHFEFHPGGLK
jgi:hypothetical protein